MRNSTGPGSRGKLNLGRRGSIAVWIAVMAPGLMMATALAVEAGSWAAAQVSVQRAADVSAMAAAMTCLGAGSCATDATKHTAASFAARIAQLNGASPASSPSWTSGTSTLADNQITASVVSGVQTPGDVAIKVSVQRSIQSGVSRPFNSTGSYTVTGTGIAEVVTRTVPPTGVGATQPCLLALSSSGAGINGSGSPNITSQGCSMRSNSTVTFSGGGSLNVAGVFAGGSISIPTYWLPQPSEVANDGTIPDPYASNTNLQSALTAAAALTGQTTISCANETCTGLSHGSTCANVNGVTCTLYPGNYGGLTVSGGGPFTFNCQPGLYSFQGAVAVANATTTFNGTGGVTLVAAGGFSFQNQPTVNITAPTVTQSQATNGGIAAIALASQSTTTVSLSGSAVYNVEGVSYFPNAQFNASGSNGTNATACMEIIASSIVLTGSSYYNSNCSSLGATVFYSVSATTTTAAAVVH
jgi:Flp pilus assembly protein TadG